MLLSRVCSRYTGTSSTYMYMWVPSTGCQIVFLAYPSDQVLIVSYWFSSGLWHLQFRYKVLVHVRSIYQVYASHFSPLPPSPHVPDPPLYFPYCIYFHGSISLLLCYGGKKALPPSKFVETSTVTVTVGESGSFHHNFHQLKLQQPDKAEAAIKLYWRPPTSITSTSFHRLHFFRESISPPCRKKLVPWSFSPPWKCFYFHGSKY